MKNIKILIKDKSIINEIHKLYKKYLYIYKIYKKHSLKYSAIIVIKGIKLSKKDILKQI